MTDDEEAQLMSQCVYCTRGGGHEGSHGNGNLTWTDEDPGFVIPRGFSGGSVEPRDDRRWIAASAGDHDD